jgi:hypothetical protein
MHKLRSSFFYFLFPIVGGTFASVALCFYYSRVLRTRSTGFAIIALLSGLLLHTLVYASIAQELPAPFYLRDFLNQTRGATMGSIYGLLIALCHLILLRWKEQIDLMIFIEREWPTVPNLLCCAIGGMLNICIVGSVYLYFN